MTNKRHQRRYMRSVDRILCNLLEYIITNDFLGLRLSVHGKFGGRLRKKVYNIFKGYRPLTRKSTFIDYDLQKMHSRFGVFSIKV
jgi:ribosomal protein S3